MTDVLSPIDEARRARGEPISSATRITGSRPTRQWSVQVEPPAPVQRRRQPQAVTAAAQVVDTKIKNPARPRAMADWQREAWTYAKVIPELHYASSFIGSCLSRVHLGAGLLGPDGNVGPVFDEDGKPIQGVPLAETARGLIADLRSSVGGQPQMMSAFGQNLSIAGEVWLLGEDEAVLNPVTKETVVLGRQWEALSTNELRSTSDGGLQRFRTPAKGVDVPADSISCRIWRSDPEYSGQPDSSVRACLGILEELFLLTLQGIAQTKSRIASAGVFFVPEGAFPHRPPSDGQPEGEDGFDAFVRDLIELSSKAIAEPGAASAFVPLIISMNENYIEKLRRITFEPPDDPLLIEKRKEAVLRMAQGMDLPVEIVTGMMQTTFANAGQIDEATWKAHIEPLVELICDGLTVGYLRPMLLATGGDPTEVARMVVAFDSSELVTHPNREAAAAAAVGTARNPNFLISLSAGRHAVGWSDNDAPDDDEIAERTRIAQLLNVRETIQGLVPEGQDSGTAIDNATGGAPVAASALAVRVAAAAEPYIERAIERAGARIRAKANGKPGVKDAVAGVANGDVAQAIGPALVASLVPEDELFAGEFAAFGRTVATWAATGGHPSPGALAEAAVATVERLARQRLYGDVRVEADVFEGGLQLAIAASA